MVNSKELVLKECRKSREIPSPDIHPLLISMNTLQTLNLSCPVLLLLK
jgi:hypothetical protein